MLDMRLCGLGASIGRRSGHKRGMGGSVGGVPPVAKAVNFQVVRTIPSGAVVIGKRADIRIVEGEQTAARAPSVSYEDIGGLEREVARVREMVELPLKFSRVFERLGIL